MIETIDPTTGEVIERIALMEAPQIEMKLAEAARGALRWAGEDFSGRGSLLRAVAARFRLERQQEEHFAADRVEFQRPGQPLKNIVGRRTAAPLLQPSVPGDAHAGARRDRQMRVGARVFCRARRSVAQRASHAVFGRA